MVFIQQVRNVAAREVAYQARFDVAQFVGVVEYRAARHRHQVPRGY